MKKESIIFFRMIRDYLDVFLTNQKGASEHTVKSYKQTLNQMLDYLAKYTDTHFGDEEALQKEVCYPDYDKHHAKHEEFKQTIQELNEMLQEEEGPSDAFVQKVEEHVVKWFYRHISSFDRSVAEYINMRESGGRL